jgi:hypothetical protein
LPVTASERERYRREEEERDLRGDIAIEQKGSILKVLKLQICILGTSNSSLTII